MQKKYDHLLFPILNEVGGTGKDLLKVVLGFVDRNTDFFKEKNAKAKKTFQEMKLMKEEAKNPPVSSSFGKSLREQWEDEFWEDYLAEKEKEKENAYKQPNKSVKKKEDRKSLLGYSCKDCEDFYKVL